MDTRRGEVLICMKCAVDTEPSIFTYLHGYFFNGYSAVRLRDALRPLGGTVSRVRQRVLCPWCHNRHSENYHDGHFRLWRSVRLQVPDFYRLWATVNTDRWTPLWAAAGDEYMLEEAAEWLRGVEHMPWMLERRGPDEGRPLLAPPRMPALPPGPAAMAAYPAAPPPPGPLEAMQAQIADLQRALGEHREEIRILHIHVSNARATTHELFLRWIQMKETVARWDRQ
jgi:hypothetical protein